MTSFKFLVNSYYVVVIMLVQSSVQQIWWEPTKALQITKANLRSTIQKKTSETSYAVEFFSPNCIYCKTFKPDWDRLAEEFNDKSDIKISVINGQFEPEIAKMYKITAFPTLLFFSPATNGLYTFGDVRNYENVKKWILDCKAKEDQKPKKSGKQGMEAMLAKIHEAEEKLKKKEEVDLNELNVFVKEGLETLELQNAAIESFAERLKNVTKAINSLRKEAFTSDGSSITFFVVCGIVTLAVVLFLACICKETGGNMKTEKVKPKKEKIEDDLPPLQRPHIDSLYDDESYITHHTDDPVKNRGK